MNKIYKAIICLIAFVLTGGVFLYPKTQVVSAQSNDRSLKLHNFNNWRMNLPAELTPQQKVEIIAKRDIVTMTESYAAYDGFPATTNPLLPANLKSVNPDVKVYRIYDLGAKNTWDSDWNTPTNTSVMQTPITKDQIDTNNWWLRDASGNIIKENDNTWLIDYGKLSYKEALLQAMLDRVSGKDFDGFVFDYVVEYNAGAVGYTSKEDWLARSFKPFISYIFDGLKAAGYKVVSNTMGIGTINSSNDPTGAFQYAYDQADAVTEEQGALACDSTTWARVSVMTQRFITLGDTNKEVWFGGGCLNPFGVAWCTQDTMSICDRKILLSLAYYYIGIPTNQNPARYFAYRGAEVFWDPLWDFNIGSPTEDKVPVSGKYAWSRKYTNGLVLLNYDWQNDPNRISDITFTLDKEYVDSAGTTYSGTVTLPVNTALILQIKPVPPTNPDILVTKSASATSVISGSTITYTITLNNQGGQTAKSVVLTDPIDTAKLQFISADRSGTFSNNTVSWPAIDITAGATETFTFQVRVL